MDFSSYAIFNPITLTFDITICNIRTCTVLVICNEGTITKNFATYMVRLNK